MEVSLTDEQRAETFVQNAYDTTKVVLTEYPLESSRFPVRLWKYTAFVNDDKVGGWVSNTIETAIYGGSHTPSEVREMHAGRLLHVYGVAELAQMMKATEHDPDDVPDEIDV
jgi:hypothetical protein